MEGAESIAVMSEEGRALLTETERKILTGEKDVKDNYKYKVESVIRNRVRKRLERDVDVLEEHLPDVHETVQEAVCDE